MVRRNLTNNHIYIYTYIYIYIYISHVILKLLGCARAFPRRCLERGVPPMKGWLHPIIDIQVWSTVNNAGTRSKEWLGGVPHV